VRAGEIVLIDGESDRSVTAVLVAAALLSRPSTGKVLVGGADVWALSRGSRDRLRAARIGLLRTATPTWRLPGRFRTPAARFAHDAPTAEHRLAAILRALETHPRILIADEPTRGLDPVVGSEIMRLLRRLNADEGLSIIMASRDRSLTPYATRCLSMSGGRLVHEPTSAHSGAVPWRDAADTPAG